jgi:hypothetical protein
MRKAGEHSMDAGEMLRHVLKTQGVRGLFVGLGAQFARDIPFYAFFFGTYELSMRQLKVGLCQCQEGGPAARPCRLTSSGLACPSVRSLTGALVDAERGHVPGQRGAGRHGGVGGGDAD